MTNNSRAVGAHGKALSSNAALRVMMAGPRSHQARPAAFGGEVLIFVDGGVGEPVRYIFTEAAPCRVKS